MARKQLYINGVGTGDYGIYISSDTYLNAPAPDITAHSVPARNGDLIQWNRRLNNIVRKFTCYIPSDAQSNFQQFKRMLYSNVGYVRIQSDYEPDLYQLGYLADEIETEPFQRDENLTVTFELYFSCEPQKYFNDNVDVTIPYTCGCTSNIPKSYGCAVLPRTHSLVQEIFQQIPQSAIPSDEAFVYVACNILMLSSRYPMSLTDWSFDSHGYSGFVAAFFGANLQLYDQGIKLHNLIGYSTDGTLDASRLVLQEEDKLPYNGGVALLFPISARCQYDISFTNNTGAVVTYSDSNTLQPAYTLQELEAIGIHYNLKIEGTYSFGGRTPSEEKYYGKLNAFYLLGSIGAPTRKDVFKAYINIDATPFGRLVTDNSREYPITITIDSETMMVEATFDGVSVDISDYVTIVGDMDGYSDKVEFMIYRVNYFDFNSYPLQISNIEISPKWWTV